MKKSHVLILSILAPTLLTAAALTTLDNNQPASQRTVAQVSREYTISLSGSTSTCVQLPQDIKSAVVKVDGAAVKFWPTYNDGVSEKLAGLTTAASAANAATAKTLKNLADGSQFAEAQESEFNKICSVITTGTGTATVYVYPGGGMNNGL